MRNADLTEMVVMLHEVGMDLKEALEIVKGVKKHRNSMAAQKSVEVREKRKKAKERKVSSEAYGATELLVKTKTRGKYNSICNSTRKDGRYYGV